MKTAAMILSTLLATMFMVGGAFILFTAGEQELGFAVIAAVAGLSLFMMAGVGAGAILVVSGRDPRSADDRRFFRRSAVVLIVATVVAAIGVASSAALGATPVPTTVVVIIVGIAYVALNVIVGEYLRRRDARLAPAHPVPTSVPMELLRRRVRQAITWFCVIIAVGVVVSVVVTVVAEDGSALPTLLAASVLFAALPTTFISLSVVLALNAIARTIIGTDRPRAKRIGRLIRGKEAQVSDEELDLAVRYAPVVRATSSWSTAQTIALYIGLIAINAVRVVGDGGDIDGLPLALSLLLAGVGVAVVIAGVVERRRIDRFIASHEQVPAQSPR